MDNESSADSGFADLGLRTELLKALSGLGYEEPTPIQREAIPHLVAGRDLLGQARQQGRADVAGAGLGATDGVVRHRTVRQAVDRLQAVDEVGAVGVAAIQVGGGEGAAGARFPVPFR